MDNEEWVRAAEEAEADADRPDGARPYPEIPSRDALRIGRDELDTAQLAPKCIVEAYLYADVGSLIAPGGTGKTTLFLYEAVHIVLGRPLYGLEVRTPGSVVLVTAEPSRGILMARLKRIMEGMELTDGEQTLVCSRVLIWDVSGVECRLAELDRRGNVVLTGLADAIVERFKDEAPVLVGFDPSIAFGAGERLVNDNENTLVLAARRIMRGLDCCVRLTGHTGKESARKGTLDQYAGRGGSAMSDGARLVTVLRFWDPEANDDDKLTPPPGLSVGSDEQIIVLARPKVSYALPQPLIWITRRGWVFKHFYATRLSPDTEAEARADQLERFLVSELAEGRRHTKHTLEMLGIRFMTRGPLRAALSVLMSDGRVWLERLPDHLRHSGRGAYLHPSKATTSPPPTTSPPAGEDSARTESGPNSEDSAGSKKTSPDPHPPTGGGGTGGEVPPVPTPLPTGNLAGEGWRGSASSARLGGEAIDWEEIALAPVNKWVQDFNRKAAREPGYDKDAHPRYCCTCRNFGPDKRCAAWRQLGAREGWRPKDLAPRRCRGFVGKAP